jgi:hypothetical protein
LRHLGEEVGFTPNGAEREDRMLGTLVFYPDLLE